MPQRAEHRPGEPAPEHGHYEELNVFGTPTGRTTQAREGEALPQGPIGFTWRRIEAEGC